MKKQIIAGIALSLLVLPCAVAMADSWNWDEWYEMENNIGINVIPGAKYNLVLQQGVDATGGSFAFGVELMYKPKFVMNNRLGLSIGGYFSPSSVAIVNSTTGNSENKPTLGIEIPIMGRYYFIKQGGLQPYLGAGVGINIKPESTGIAGKLRLGTDLMFSSNIGANVNVDANVDFSSFIFSVSPGLGFRILF